MKRLQRIFATFGLVLFAALMGACSQIDTGNVGVIKTGGQYKAEELPPGWHFNVISTVYEVSARENVLQFNDLKSTKTLDQITIEDVDIDVYYQLNPSKASDTMTRFAGDMATNSDGVYVPAQSYMAREAREAIYNVLATTIKSDEAQAKRSTIPGNVSKTLQAELDKKFGAGWWTITNVNVRNLTVDSKLEAKIREAAQVEYEIQTKNKQVQVAQAEANRQRAIAQGEADAIRIKAEGLRSSQGQEYLKFIELQNQAEAIKKWNGQLPTTNAGGVTPFIALKN